MTGCAKRWRRYLWGAIPTLWFWMVLAIGFALLKGNQESAQVAVNLVFYMTGAFLLLGWITRGAAETTWTDCMIVWSWSAGFYVLMVPAIAVFVAVQAAGVTSLMWLGGEIKELGIIVFGISVLVSAWAYYQAVRRWMSFVIWWGNTIRFERSLTYARYCVRWWKRSPAYRWKERERNGDTENVAGVS